MSVGGFAIVVGAGGRKGEILSVPLPRMHEHLALYLFVF